MRYRLRTLLIWAALIPPLLAVAALGLERTYFSTVHQFRRRMIEPRPVRPTHKVAIPPSVVQGNDDAQPESP
jgi:hypothetical protein